MSEKNGKKILPFELGETEYYEIEVFPKRKQQLKLLEKNTPATLAKLSKHFTETEGGRWVIKLEKFYGFTGGEEEKLKDNSADLRHIFVTLQELILEIGTRTGAAPEQVREYCNDPITYAEHLIPKEIDKILSLNKYQTAASKDYPTITAIIQGRLEGSWGSEDTLALPTELREKFLDYAMAEKEGWPAKQEGKKNSTGHK